MQTQSRLNIEFLKSIAPEANQHLKTDENKQVINSSVEPPYYSPTAIVVNLEKVEKAFREVGYFDNNTKEFKPLDIPEGSIYKKPERHDQKPEGPPEEDNEDNIDSKPEDDMYSLRINLYDANQLFNNKNVNIYMVNNDKQNKIEPCGSWPGIPMLKSGIIYEYYFQEFKYDTTNLKVIFSTNDAQTIELDFSKTYNLTEDLIQTTTN